MTIVYKILNPLNGEYITANNPDECLDFVADIALNLLNNMAHNAPYSVVEINEDGSQVWRNPQGEEIMDPIKLRKRAGAKMARPILSIPVTPVERFE